MIRKIISLHVFATLVCLGVTNLAKADCASCGGGCAVGGCQGCQTGGCRSGGCGLLGKLSGQGGNHQAGPCRTCDDIWDDYCASKPHCLPGARYPFQNMHGGHLLGNCNGCPGAGVGIYGTQCCPPKAHGHMFGKLFAHKKKPVLCATGCAEDGCADGGCAGIVSGPGAAPLQSAPDMGHPPATPKRGGDIQQPGSVSPDPVEAEVPITAPVVRPYRTSSDAVNLPPVTTGARPIGCEFEFV